MSAFPLQSHHHAAFCALMRVLNPTRAPSTDPEAFDTLLAHPGTTIWGIDAGGRLASTATLHLLPNLTYAGRPYGLIENVVTLPDERGRGLARELFDALRQQAIAANAYKLMLLTGNQRGAQGFYHALGFDSTEKSAMILRLP